MTLPEYICSHLNMPFVWGENDCILFAIGWVEISTGKDYLAEHKPWNTAKQALRIVKNLGGLEATFDRLYERINPNMAKDGDLSLYNNAACLFTGRHIVGPSHTGLIHLDRTHTCHAWRYS